jgi:hypothetical protein
MEQTVKKKKIVDIDTARKMLGCTRSNMYSHYLKKGILSPVPRVGKKAYFLLDEVNNILNEKLASIAARKNLELKEVERDTTELSNKEFYETYTELTIN